MIQCQLLDVGEGEVSWTPDTLNDKIVEKRELGQKGKTADLRSEAKLAGRYLVALADRVQLVLFVHRAAELV